MRTEIENQSMLRRLAAGCYIYVSIHIANNSDEWWDVRITLAEALNIFHRAQERSCAVVAYLHEGSMDLRVELLSEDYAYDG